MADLKYDLADDLMNAVCHAAENFTRPEGVIIEAIRVDRFTTLQTMITVRTENGSRQFIVKLSEPV